MEKLFKSLTVYVENKSCAFLEDNGLGNEFPSIKEKAERDSAFTSVEEALQHQGNHLEKYYTNLMNYTVNAVFQAEQDKPYPVPAMKSTMPCAKAIRSNKYI